MRRRYFSAQATVAKARTLAKSRCRPIARHGFSKLPDFPAETLVFLTLAQVLQSYFNDQTRDSPATHSSHHAPP